MSRIDETFAALPLRALADAALSRAGDLGCSHADIRIVRALLSQRSFRDRDLESSSDNQTLGLSIRVVHDGVWGFAAGITPHRRVGRRPGRPGGGHREGVPAAHAGPGRAGRRAGVRRRRVGLGVRAVNPFEVADAERSARMLELSGRLLDADGVSHTSASLTLVQENTFFANLAGTRTQQQRIRLMPSLTAISVSDAGFATMSTIAPPAGRGWEYLSGTGWDFDAEIAEMPSLLAEHVAAPSVEPGRYDLVIDPTNLWLTIHESIGHATELDRALGYEAAYAGHLLRHRRPARARCSTAAR